MSIKRYDYTPDQSKYLARQFRETVTSDIADQNRKNDYFAGYVESFLAQMALRYPEFRQDLEDRVVYANMNKGK